MHVPTDRSLVTWIRELEKAGKLYKFYKTAEFQELRTRVLEKDHNECVMCMEKGRYSPAKVVHHVKEVRDFPELALSLYYNDSEGQHRNLLSLCQNCHEIVHGRAFKGRINEPRYDKERFPERW